MKASDPTTAEVAPAPAPDDLATSELFRQLLEDTRNLVRLEVALAREEIQDELAGAKSGGMALGAAGVLAVSAFTMFMVAIANAWHLTWFSSLIIGIILMSMSGVMALYGWHDLPKKPLPETKERVSFDLQRLAERIRA